MTELSLQIAREYGTPAVVIDLDRVERNIARLQAACDAAGVANRPHIKTHKSPAIAAMQREAGAGGITCQKLGEAEVMAEAGFDDILISYNLLGQDKIARLAALMDKARMTVCADNPTVVEGLAAAPELAGRPLDVIVECDTGRKRAGVLLMSDGLTMRQVARKLSISQRTVETHVAKLYRKLGYRVGFLEAVEVLVEGVANVFSDGGGVIPSPLRIQMGVTHAIKHLVFREVVRIAGLTRLIRAACSRAN